MIIPVGTESDGVRRLPWVTFTIMAICLIVHIMVNSKVDKLQKELTESAQAYLQYYITHPYLEMDPDIKAIFFSYPGAEEELESFKSMQGNTEPYEFEREEQQAELDEMGDKFLATMNNHPFKKWGYTPAKKSLLTQFTSMFLHGDWLHLIFNMLFLYISAPFIEDVWGRAIFIVFYILMGLLSAFAHALHYPHSTVALIGASGAIAGVMGAFLVRFWNVKIKFIYFFSIIIRGTFSAPAWLMLPLWVIEEVIQGKFSDSLEAYGGSGGGVAHWVHVWGFVFGLLIALAMKFLKIEEKFIAPKILQETSYVNESLSVVEKAMDTMAAGGKEEAYRMLLEAAKKDPRNGDILNPLWSLAIELDKKTEIAPFLQRQVDVLVRQNQHEAAFLYFVQLREHVPGTHFSVMTSIIMLQQMIKRNQYQEAEQLALEVASDVNLSVAPGVLLDFCTVLSSIDLERNRTHAQKFLKMALKHPDIPETTKDELKKRIFDNPQPDTVDTMSVGAAAAMAIKTTKPPAAPVASTPSFASVSTPTSPTLESGTMFTLDQFSNELPPPPPFPVQLKKAESQSPDYAGSGAMFTLEQFSEEPPLPPPFPVQLKNKEVQPPPIPKEMVIQPPQPSPSFNPQAEENEPAATELITLDFSTIAAPPPPIFVQQKIIKPTFAAPLEIKDGRLALNVDGVGQRALPFQKIKAMAVAKITPTGQNPFLLVDLFLDEPNTMATNSPQSPIIDIRSLRITSNRFNPTQLIPKAQTTGEAFRIFVSGLQKLSNAVPYPNLEYVQLKKILTYPSLEVYEDSLFTSA